MCTASETSWLLQYDTISSSKITLHGYSANCANTSSSILPTTSSRSLRNTSSLNSVRQGNLDPSSTSLEIIGSSSKRFDIPNTNSWGRSWRSTTNTSWRTLILSCRGSMVYIESSCPMEGRFISLLWTTCSLLIEIFMKLMIWRWANYFYYSYSLYTLPIAVPLG